MKEFYLVRGRQARCDQASKGFARLVTRAPHEAAHVCGRKRLRAKQVDLCREKPVRVLAAVVARYGNDDRLGGLRVGPHGARDLLAMTVGQVGIQNDQAIHVVRNLRASVLYRARVMNSALAAIRDGMEQFARHGVVIDDQDEPFILNRRRFGTMKNHSRSRLLSRRDEGNAAWLSAR